MFEFSDPKKYPVESKVLQLFWNLDEIVYADHPTSVDEESMLM